MRTPALNFSYLGRDQSGYGIHGVETHKALGRIGIDVQRFNADDPRTACKDIVFLTLASHVDGWLEGQRRHLFTMWESLRLPETLRESLHNYETIIVPSEACKVLYGEFHPNVIQIPLGVDGGRWKYQPRQQGMFFKFLTAGNKARKGTDLVHEAFLELFAGKDLDPIPQLIIKSNSDHFSGREIYNRIGWVSPEEEVDLYAEANCYVQPSRGEGWGMQPMQAIAQGCPTILTNAHGHASFAKYGIPISAGTSKAAYFHHGNGGEWWEPDFEELKVAMWDVYQNYAEYVRKARVNSQIIREGFTWERSAEALVEAIGGRERLTEPYSGNGSFIRPDVSLFPVTPNKNMSMYVGSKRFEFQKGVEAKVPADVKRILEDSKALVA